MGKFNQTKFTHRLNIAARKNELYRPTDVARAADLSPITVAAYMRGTRGASYLACVHLGRALGVNPDWLFCASDDIDGKPLSETPLPPKTVQPPDNDGGPDCSITVVAKFKSIEDYLKAIGQLHMAGFAQAT